MLGLGAGFPIPESEDEFRSVGVPFAQRAARMDEIARYWRTAWKSHIAGAPTAHTGALWHQEGLDRLPAPATPNGPPLWLAGGDTPDVLARVASSYDGWLPFLPTAPVYGAAWQRLQERSSSYGRVDGAITPALYATVSLNRESAKAEQTLEEYLLAYYGRPLAVMSQVQAYGFGNAERCIEWLAGYVRAGARHIIIRIGALDDGDQIEELAATVVPAIRALT